MAFRSINTDPATRWLDHADTEARRAQQAVDDLEKLNLPAQWGEIDLARQRNELSAARDEYADEAAYWRHEFNEQRAG